CKICTEPTEINGGWCLGRRPAEVKVASRGSRSASETPMSKSTSRVARTCRQAASARPPMTAIGAWNGSRLTQTCFRAFRTASAATRTAPAVKLFEEMTHGPIMLRHLLGVPLAVGGAPVATGADLAAQPGQQELLTGIQPLRPKFNAP